MSDEKRDRSYKVRKINGAIKKKGRTQKEGIVSSNPSLKGNISEIQIKI
jgi:hypothetical protein